MTVERIATNRFIREVIDPARPTAYWADLPSLERLPERLQQAGIPAADSFYGGQRLRNLTLYSSLYFAERDGLPRRSGFVHIPLLPEQVIRRHWSSPVMPLEMTRRALFLVIAEVAAA